MINAPNRTLFGAGHGIGRPGQADSEYGAATKAQAAATKMRGAGFVRYWLDNSRPSGAPQGHAGVVR